MAKKRLIVIWSPEAIADKIEILNYWYSRIGTKTYSIKLNKQLDNVIKFLSEYPNTGRFHTVAKMLYFIKDHYYIFYKIENNVLQIMQVWDGRRNQDMLIK